MPRADDGLTPRERQIAQTEARLDICLPEGGHEYERGEEGCIHCGEPFPVIARDYGSALMPARHEDKVWVPNGTSSLSSEYRNILNVPEGLPKLEDVRAADLVIVGDKIIKNRYGPEGKLVTLESFWADS